MKQLVQHAPHGSLYAPAVTVAEPVEACEQPLHLFASNGLRVRPQTPDHRRRLARPVPAPEPPGVVGDQLLCRAHLGRAGLVCGPHHLLQIIDVVEEDRRQLAHGRLDVSRQGDVENHERRGGGTAGPRQLSLGDHGARSRRRRDQDVRTRQRAPELIHRHGPPPYSRYGFRGPLGSPVRHEDVGSALRQEASQGRLTHVAGAEHDGGPTLERAEDLDGEPHRRRRNRGGAAAELGFRTHGPPDGQPRLEEPVQHGTHTLGHLQAGLIRIADLAEDLGLPEDERIQTGGHAKEVHHRLVAVVPVDEGLRVGGRQAGARRQRLERRSLSGRRVRDVKIEFGAVARGEDDALLDPIPAHET